jgi:hypothetical protein
MNNLFTTKELTKLSGLSRGNLEYYRREKIIKAASDKPLRWNYKTVIFCLMIKEFKQKMNKNLALESAKCILEFYSDLEFIEQNNELIIISAIGKKLLVFISRDTDNISNSNGELFKYFDSSIFLDLDDFNTGKRLQIILDNRYVFYLSLAKKHIERLCIDYGYQDKIPSLAIKS